MGSHNWGYSLPGDQCWEEDTLRVAVRKDQLLVEGQMVVQKDCHQEVGMEEGLLHIPAHRDWETRVRDLEGLLAVMGTLEEETQWNRLNRSLPQRLLLQAWRAEEVLLGD
jgi:hypothetical protein